MSEDNAKKNENFLLSIQRGSFRDSLEISVKKSQKSLVVVLSRRRKFASSSFPRLWRGFHFSLLPFDVLATLPREEILFVKDLNKADADARDERTCFSGCFRDERGTGWEFIYKDIFFYSATFFSLKKYPFDEINCMVKRAARTANSQLHTGCWLPLIVIDSPSLIPAHSRRPSVLLVGLRGFENQGKLLVFFALLPPHPSYRIESHSNHRWLHNITIATSNWNDIIFLDKIVTSSAACVSARLLLALEKERRDIEIDVNLKRSNSQFNSFAGSESAHIRCRHLILYFNLKHFFAASLILNVFLGSQWAFLCEKHCHEHNMRWIHLHRLTAFPSLSTTTTIDTYCWDISVGEKSFHNGEPENEIEFHERNELFSSYLLWWEKIMKRQYLLLLEHEEWHHHEREIRVRSKKKGRVKKDVEIFQSSKRRRFVSREESWWWAWREGRRRR